MNRSQMLRIDRLGRKLKPTHKSAYLKISTPRIKLQHKDSGQIHSQIRSRKYPKCDNTTHDKELFQ